MSIKNLVLSILLLIYYYLQFHTLILDNNYWLKICFLFVLTLIPAYYIYYLLVNHFVTSNVFPFVFYSFCFLFFLLMFVGKFFIFYETKYVPSDNLLRNYTKLSIPYTDFNITTKDNVRINGYHIQNGHNEVVIVCHGATRSKDILGNIMLCEWLSTDFDIVTFDFRGHHESGGELTFDDKTVNDLEAVIEYTRKFNYKKIGIVGRSLGGWTALLYSSQYHNVNSVISAASPINNLDKSSFLSKSPKFLMPVIKILARIQLDFRFSINNSTLIPNDVIDKISPTPLLLIYCETDPTAGTKIDEVNEFYNRAKEPKKLIVFKGTGHILETKNVINYYTEIKKWFIYTLKESQ